MKKFRICLALFLMPMLCVWAQERMVLPLNSAQGLRPVNVQVSPAALQGKECIKVLKQVPADGSEQFETLIIVDGSQFKNGVIEVELAGDAAAGTSNVARGFVGVAFHIDPENIHSYKCFYLRPLNGRAENQLQRNHSVQYIAHPEHTWHSLRTGQPGVYESYVDLVPGEFTKVRIVVIDKRAELYVHDADQPTLIVNDLKSASREGLVGLWLHTTTEAHYRNLKIIPAE